LKKRSRIRRSQDFTRVIRTRRIYAGTALLGFAAARDDGRIRVGVTSSRDVKGAVARNRVRRRLRALAREVLLGDDSPLRTRGIGYDVVLIARGPALEVAHAHLQAEARRLLERLAGER
jgi:ribonuclease P protein component